MGSPPGERGRYDDEGPQHQVQLTQGFWLFDTPCTQALWQAVMGTHPSQFTGEQRPVENVCWDDCQQFLMTFNQQFPELPLILPTEAQWEYACRAGIQAARYEARIDAIAWYSANGHDETHVVGQKRPNAWGLYDMLGNVWEWCHDGLRTYDHQEVVDPTGPLDAGADRVIRGGSWCNSALGVRAAGRYWSLPGYRNGSLGFRCASSGMSA
jgi:formylglycine-generating enzyme required for sulfatase activity